MRRSAFPRLLACAAYPVFPSQESAVQNTAQNRQAANNGSAASVLAVEPRTGFDVEDIKKSFIENLICGAGRLPAGAAKNDFYAALPA